MNALTGVSYAYHVSALNGTAQSAYLANVAIARSQSSGLYDGYVNVSSVFNGPTYTVLRAGQGPGAGNQQKTIVSFDTSPLVTGAVVTSARLRMKQISDNTAFNTLLTCKVDIKSGDFGTRTLEFGDFSAQSTYDWVATVPQAGPNAWGDAVLNANGIASVKVDGDTQLRVYFDANNAQSTYITWYPGESPGNEPVLIVNYQTP